MYSFLLLWLLSFWCSANRFFHNLRLVYKLNTLLNAANKYSNRMSIHIAFDWRWSGKLSHQKAVHLTTRAYTVTWKKKSRSQIKVLRTISTYICNLIRFSMKFVSNFWGWASININSHSTEKKSRLKHMVRYIFVFWFNSILRFWWHNKSVENQKNVIEPTSLKSYRLRSFFLIVNFEDFNFCRIVLCQNQSRKLCVKCQSHHRSSFFCMHNKI